MVNGFQKEISRKTFDFLGHLHIKSFDSNRSYEDINPIDIRQNFYPHLDTIEGIRNIQPFANKPGIIKITNDFEGIILKGIDSSFNWNNFKPYLIDGRPIVFADSVKSNEVIVSQITAKRLHLGLGDRILIYFIQEKVRQRKLEIVGIYKTGLEEYDEKFALFDIRHVQKLNGWNEHQIGGFEVFIDDVNDLDRLSELVYYDVIGENLYSQSAKQVNPNLFEWLKLHDMNERVILALMIIVAIINMITALLILILERTNMIGIMKAMGAGNWSIRKIFLYNAGFIIGVGLLVGNALGLLICYAQLKFEFIKLPESSYYLSVAPIDISFPHIIILNILTLVVCLFVLVIPSYLVSTIDPIKAIRFK